MTVWLNYSEILVNLIQIAGLNYTYFLNIGIFLKNVENFKFSVARCHLLPMSFMNAFACCFLWFQFLMNFSTDVHFP